MYHVSSEGSDGQSERVCCRPQLDGGWGGGLLAERAVGRRLVAFLAQALDQHLGLAERGESLAVETLVLQLAVEGLDIAVLPRATGCDRERGDADPRESGADGPGGELGAIIRAQLGGRSPLDEDVRQAGHDVLGPQAAGDHYAEAFACVLVHNAPQAEGRP